MQTNRKSVNKEAVIETALQLIDDNEGIKNVTLRVIAKKLGCAHTNLYNYFNSLDEIYWESLVKVLSIMLNYSDVDESIKTNVEEKLFLKISSIVDFALDHPNWYKLIWFETIESDPSEEILKMLLKPSEDFANALIEASKKELTKERVMVICDILWGYVHGELCKWINQRSFISSRIEMKENIISNFKLLYSVLIK